MRRTQQYWLKTVAMDILLVGIGLVIFAYFQHVRPGTMETAQVLVADVQSEETELGTETEVETELVADALTTGIVPSAAQDGTLSYAGEKYTLSITSGRKSGSWYYVADIRVTDPSVLRTAFAKDKAATGYAESVEDMAVRNNAVFATNGDYFGMRKKGVVVRNGVLYRKKMSSDTCVLFADGTMETYTEKTFDEAEVTAKQPLQAWSFGPSLFDENGNAINGFSHAVAPKNPRTVIGYYEPGHYCIVCVDGRGTKKDGQSSSGMTLTELSALMKELGCAKAYNLDGGQSSVMWFNGEIVSSPYKGGRRSSDIIYLGKED